MIQFCRAIRLAVGVAVFSLLACAAFGQQAPSSSSERTLLFVGDVMLSRGVGRVIKANDDWTYPFQAVAETLRAADLTFANLECPVSDVGRDLHHKYSFRAEPRVIEGLKFAGFDVVSVANNHMYDWGEAALVDTVRRLRESGIVPVGAGANDLEAHYPRIVDLGGVKLAFLAYAAIAPKEAAAGPARPGIAWLAIDRVLADIRFARPIADIVIVSLHWGVEYARQPSREQVKLAHQMIDAGTDFVVGSHPHVVQPLEQYGRGWIAYSLGNFVFDQRPGPMRRGLMLKVTLRNKRINEVTMFPTAINETYQAELGPAGGQSERAERSRTKPPVVRAQ